jgi:hypothetical protein
MPVAEPTETEDATTSPYPASSFPGIERAHGNIVRNAERREMRSDSLGHIARGQMRVVLFRHACIGVAELFGDHAHRNARIARVEPCVCRNTGSPTPIPFEHPPVRPVHAAIRGVTLAEGACRR